MMKRLVPMLGLLFSLNVHAGYVEYDLEGTSSSARNAFMVMRDTDKSIAFYFIPTDFGLFQPSDKNNWWTSTRLIDSTNSFVGMGPTDMHLKQVVQEGYDSEMWLTFTPGADSKTFNYTIHIVNNPYSPYSILPTREVTFTGTAQQVPASDNHVAMIEDPRKWWYPLTQIPTYTNVYGEVPEPASLSIIGLGLLGLIGVRRRR